VASPEDKYVVGQTVRMIVKTERMVAPVVDPDNPAYELFDPSPAPSFKVKKPVSGTVVTYSGAAVTRDSLGLYRADHLTDEAGSHYYSAEASGIVQEDAFFVRPKKVA
jgi:hypothetical protein